MGLVAAPAAEPAAAGLRVGRGRDAYGLMALGPQVPTDPEGEVRGPRQSGKGGRLAGEDQAERHHASRRVSAAREGPCGKTPQGLRGRSTSSWAARTRRRLGQLKDLPSDAYATGQALYLLAWPAETATAGDPTGRGVPDRHPEGRRLLADDLARAPGAKPCTNPVPITYFGSAWATLGPDARVRK